MRIERQQRIDDKRKEGKEEVQHLGQLIKVNTLDKKNFERGLEATNHSSERKSKEYNELIETLQNKTNIFNRKQKEKEIEKANEESKYEEERLIKHANYLNDRILETNKEIEALENKKMEVASKYACEITDIATAQKDSEDNFNKQQEIFNQINSETDLSELSYFNQYSLKDIVTLITKISNTKVKKQETEVLLEQSKMEQKDIVSKIESLNNEIDTVLKEREELKEKITTTKEGFEKQAKDTINTVKSAVDTAFNYEVPEEEKNNEKENKRKSEGQESLEDLIDKIIDGGSHNSGDVKKEGTDTIGGILNGFLNGNPEEATEKLVKRFLGKRK